MSNVFIEAARSMMSSRARGELIQEAQEAAELPPGTPREEFLIASGVAREVLRLHAEELESRRRWAQRIREEFGKYHEHEGGHPCGACGSIQAANWMDPDYLDDGPLAEPYGTWRDRQS